jgi:uncharacterized protein
MSSFRESVLTFRCQSASLIGILAAPAQAPAAEIGALIVVGGPQYRAGSHRQFTLLARDLACAGFACLRFDYRGMGDSDGEARNFEAVNSDIQAAIDAMMSAQPQLRGIVLWGLCDAASAALMYVGSTKDARIKGLALVNPWVRSAASLAQAHVKHYYWQRIRQPEFWRKLLSGGVGRVALSSLLSNLRLARAGRQANRSLDVLPRTFQERMADGLHSFANPVLLILSGQDLTAREFLEHAERTPPWTEMLERHSLIRHDLADADHTFSDLGHTRHLQELTVGWLRQLSPRL